MENSADALQLAFGVIIAVLLLSLLVYVFNNISSFENTKRDQAVSQQTAEFNKKFLAFDKTSMYATDVISVLGLAISNNKIQNQAITANPLGNYEKTLDYSINIEIVIEEDIKAREITTAYIEEKDSGTGLVNQNKIPEGDSRLPTSMHGKNPSIKEDTQRQLSNGTYSLDIYKKNSSGEYEVDSSGNKKTDDTAKHAYEMLEGIAVSSDGYVKPEIKTKGRIILKTERDTYGLNDFKKTIYKCEKIGYDGSGKINYMKFVTVDTN